MKNRILLITCLLFAGIVQAQSDNDINKRASFRDRTYVGGGLGAGFGTVNWFQLSPVVGYMITQDFSAGMGIQYRYASYKNFTPKITTSDFGLNPFLRYNIRDPFFIQAEYEYLNYDLVYTDGSKQRENNSALLAGGGMSQRIGGKAFFNITVLYNLTYRAGDILSPYRSPWVLRAGISLGL